MNQSIANTADRYTILCLKREHGLDLGREIEDYEAALKGVDCQDLYEINRIMWKIEEMISTEADLSKIGAYYLALRWMNAKRVRAKNKIAKKCGEPLEKKKY